MSQGKARILIVDDDKNICGSVEQWLSAHGYEVKTVNDAKSAQEALMERAPDLVLMDVMMPDMNGIDLCHWIWKQEALKGIPIIQMSGLSDDVTMQDSLEMGTMDYVIKPFDFKVMLKKVEKALTRARKRKEE